ncbi:hypothetical protein JOS77_13665 [Chromobacterium haemolyticum]|nr:hypothetical protein JOS77_13665 [Chromobacterium haemolyticum]
MRFANCQVTSLRGPSGILVTNPAQDPLLSCSVGNAIGKPSGKMVDLDPDWQLASSIYGLAVSLLKPDGTPLMTADYQSNPFRDLWFSRAQSQGDSAASAVFQSVLTNIQWHLDGFDSPLLARLIELSEQDRLSIRLSTYGYSTDYSDPGFGYGTVLGAIGPAYLGQPRSFILGRRFMPTTQQGNDLASKNGIGCFSSWLDQDTASLQVDLSNALPLDSHFQVAALPSLQYAVLHNEWTAQDAEIGPDDYTVVAGVDTSQALQDQQAGIQSVPLTEEQLRLANQPLPLAIVQPVGVEGRAVSACARPCWATRCALKTSPSAWTPTIRTETTSTPTFTRRVTVSRWPARRWLSGPARPCWTTATPPPTKPRAPPRARCCRSTTCPTPPSASARLSRSPTRPAGPPSPCTGRKASAPRANTWTASCSPSPTIWRAPIRRCNSPSTTSRWWFSAASRSRART